MAYLQSNLEYYTIIYPGHEAPLHRPEFNSLSDPKGYYEILT